MKIILINIGVTIFIIALSLIAYDHLVLRPSLQIGIVDVAEIYRLKEREFTDLVTKTGSDADRQKALLMADQFAKALPAALEELPKECDCLVLLKTAVPARAPNTMDMTAVLKQKIGMQ
jgi:hypothetical protein